MKILSILLVLLVVSNALTDKEILQDGLNGFFEANSLPKPTNIVPCLDDTTAHNTVEFITEVLEKAARGSVQDLINLIPIVGKFLQSFPEPVR